MRWPPSVSFGFLSVKVERLGAELSVALITTDPVCTKNLIGMDEVTVPLKLAQ